MFTTVFGIQCKFFIVWSIWREICRSNRFFLFHIAKRAEVLSTWVCLINTGRQFVHACIKKKAHFLLCDDELCSVYTLRSNSSLMLKVHIKNIFCFVNHQTFYWIFHNRTFTLNLKRNLKEKWRKNKKDCKVNKQYLFEWIYIIRLKTTVKNKIAFFFNYVASLFTFFENVCAILWILVF